ncbi:hypothetical protein HII36_15035 [Nonomuraea sp. NN258]|uniref:hypothetical protein n=1 Tax=Nonomuraea antri TaxID=2730852 RepID=UPI0015690536|nr:hypothetical protein [Nonomuraea antri]NRQ33147.1 hypothetical protein [Nonomuraea antri]
MHWHAYTWTGAGEERGWEPERRPDSPEFPSSPLPPMLTGDWLAKPRSRIAATFTELQPALEWLSARYERARAGFPRPDGIGADLRLAAARDVLPRGVDVQWGEWLRDGRFVTIGMICCPNRHVRHPCPLGRSAYPDPR